MAGKFNSFADNLAAGILGPKGNMGDWQHASRLFVSDNQRLSPKFKHLFHVNFVLDPVASSIFPDLRNKHNLEIGMLVKSADLPRYAAETEVKHQYNRKKVIQTGVSYEPVNISFHDDTYGVTTALIEAYYRYYFRDGNYGNDPGAYNKAGSGDKTFKGPGANQYKYGLDNNVTVPFIQRIEISQMGRKSYTTYTLVNPIITAWQHDTVDYADGTTATNSITVAYESVFYNRGSVEAGFNGEPTGFGDPSHYDTTPSPITILGGSAGGLGDIIGGAIDLYDYITKGANFNNPIEAGIAAANILGGIRNLSKDGLRQQGFNLLTDVIGRTAGIDVSGVSRTFFPKNGGNGGAKDLAIATAVVAGASFVANRNKVDANNPAAVEAASKQAFQQQYQANGGTGNVNDMNAAYNNLGPNDKASLRDQVLGT